MAPHDHTLGDLVEGKAQPVSKVLLKLTAQSDLGALGIFEQGFECAQHKLAIELLGGARIVM